MTFNTTRLVEQINLKGSLPQGRFETQEILDVAYDVLLSEVTPYMISQREEYYVRKTTEAITASQAEYGFPTRALGQALREVQIIKGTVVVDVDRIDLEEITSTAEGEPNEFYVMGNSIYLYPTPNVSQNTLQMYYFFRPSKLVPVNECAYISAIDTGTNTLTVSAPTDWTTADTFDLIQGRDGFKVRSFDLTASAVSTSSITLSELPSGLQVGDYVALSGESCFPFLPTEGHQLLVYKTVAALLESIGDTANAASADKRGLMIQAQLDNLFGTRIQGAPKQFANPLF